MRTGKFKIKRPIVAGTAASAVLIFAIWGCSKLGRNNSPLVETVKQVMPFINPPLKGINIAYTSFSVDAEKGAELQYSTGSKISIPANAFCDDNGNEIKGKVNIKYREFHDPVDFFVSGIPMTYDSGGRQYTFESAGMFDIRGEQNGRPIHIKNDKSIGVKMASKQKAGNFNQYILDTNKKAWVFLSKSEKIEPEAAPKVPITPKVEKELPAIEKPKNNLPEIQGDIAKIEDQVPVKPGMEDKKKMRFDFEADPKDFPEISMYHDFIFEVDDTCKTYQDGFSKIIWNNAELKRIKRSNSYFVTVSRGNEQHTFTVHPVFDEANYPQAKKEYDKVYADYSKALTEKKAEEAKELQRQKLEQEKQEKARKEALAQEEAQRKLQDENAAKMQQNQIVQEAALNGSQNLNYYFSSVKSFGFVNNDVPNMLPTGAELNVTYMSDEDSVCQTQSVYLADGNRNMLYMYHLPKTTFRFDPAATNFAWCITANNHLAILSPDDFRQIKQTTGACALRFHVISQKITNVDDVKALLKQYM